MRNRSRMKAVESPTFKNPNSDKDDEEYDLIIFLSLNAMLKYLRSPTIGLYWDRTTAEASPHLPLFA